MEIWTVVGGHFPQKTDQETSGEQREENDSFSVMLENADGRQNTIRVNSEALGNIRIGRTYEIRDGQLFRSIRVVAAVICRDHKVFATQRGYGEHKDRWEFPGGKIEKGELPEAALIREIREELATEIRVDRFLKTIEYDYPDFHLSMDCYTCSVVEGKLTLLEHEAAAWLSKEELGQVEWLPADVLLLNEVEKLMSE